MNSLLADLVPANLNPWFSLILVTAFSLWFVALICEIVAVTVLIFRGYRLIWRLERDAVQSALDKAEAASDRKLMHHILSTISGWIVVVEKQEERKQKHLKEVAMTAAVAAAEVKTAISDVPEKVVEKLAEKASQIPESGIHKRPTPPGGSHAE